jgi:hypothetical protein
MRPRGTAPPRDGKYLTPVVILLSFVIPGLGHLYAHLVPRAIIWFAGNMVVLLIGAQGGLSRPLRLGLFLAIGLAAAADVVVALRLFRSSDP